MAGVGVAEKVCAFTEEFADKNPKTVKAVLKALHEASVWLDKMENREEQASIVSAPTYINCPPETILGRPVIEDTTMDDVGSAAEPIVDRIEQALARSA